MRKIIFLDSLQIFNKIPGFTDRGYLIIII